MTRPTNAQMRTREYLTQDEIELLMVNARESRYGTRDAAMLMVCYRHGFRVSELCDLRWSQVDFRRKSIAVRRLKRGTPATHPMEDDEAELLMELKNVAKSDFVFVTQQGGPFAEHSFAKNLDRLAKGAGITFKVHPHMLRHSCGFTLANNGTDTRLIQGWLGHRDIKHTVVYTELAPGRFDAVRGQF
jgi:site-specific recombinase XerD